jgi:hypothetical protein
VGLDDQLLSRGIRFNQMHFLLVQEIYAVYGAGTMLLSNIQMLF